MRKVTKKLMSTSLDPDISKIMCENIGNISGYIEYLIFNHLKKKMVNGIEKINL